MASLTRKYLASIGIEEDKIDLIMEKHNEVCTEIKDERDKYKEDAEKLPEVQKQLDGYKEVEKNGEKDPYKVKYEAIKEELEDYKKTVESEKVTAKKSEAYKKLLKDAGVSDKRIAAVLKVSDIDKIEFDKEGNVKDADKLTEAIKTEWSDFIPTSTVVGASVATPPANNTNTVKSKEEIMKITNTAERQKAWKDRIIADQKGNGN